MQHEEKDIGCNGKRLLIGDIELEVDFVWKPNDGKETNDGEETNNDIVTIVVGYAPYYTLISLQTFNIAPSKIDVIGNKQEM